MVSNPMILGRLSLSLVLTCGFGLFSAGCLSKKNDEVSAEAAPPPSMYSIAATGYVGTAAAAAAAPAASGTSFQAATPPQPAPFELRFNEELVTHLIVSGESLSSISGIYNSSISRIMAANGMADTKIYAGKSLQVPIVKSSQMAMNGEPRPSTAPAYSSQAPAQGVSTPSAPAPPTNYGTPTSAPVYRGTTVEPSSTSYPRQTAPTAPAGSFPTPSF